MNQDQVRDALKTMLVEQGYEPGDRRDQIVFHMTDWLDDLARWAEICEKPEKFDAGHIEKVLTGFLLHVPNHVAAASKLMLDVPVADVFNVASTGDDDGQ